MSLVAARENDGFLSEGSDLVLVTDELGVDFYRTLGASEVLVQRTNEISDRLKINAAPYGLAVDASGIVRWSGVPYCLDDVRAMAAALAVIAR